MEYNWILQKRDYKEFASIQQKLLNAGQLSYNLPHFIGNITRRSRIIRHFIVYHHQGI
jgi:hypothetical protein